MEILPLISFTTGVISILSPCILPILPVFVGVSLKSKTRGELVSFTGGLMTVFIIIIFLTGFFTTVVYTYIAQVRLISAILLLIIGILMLFDYQLDFKALPHSASNSNYLMGVLTSVAWAPCYTGYLISLITLLVGSGDPSYAVLNIIIYCIGFALALFALSYLVSRIDLEKLITKTRYIPKIFAVLVIFGALYLLFEAVKGVF
ncbi:MAG: cytochrome c biogenesis protein CcdA [Methanobrevibacter sp.]|nr:cytochrome c biogenesis protein CcdA [Methanobrevibacter sp.]